MRVGLIGAGQIGSIHAPILARLPEIDEILIFDVDPIRSVGLAGDVGAKPVEDVDALLADSDAVIIASRTDTHAPLLTRAAEMGVAAFCEKPIALDPVSSKEAVEAVKRSGIPAQIGFQRRFDPGYRRIRDRVSRGELGQLYVVHHVSHDHDVPPADYVMYSGSLYRDNLIHDFDVARFITGDEVEEVYAAGSVLVDDYFADYGDVDTGAAVLRFGGGTLGVMHAVRHDPVGYDVRVEAFGSRDSVTAGWNDRTPIVPMDPGMSAPAQPYRRWLERFGEAYRAEMQEFVQRVRTGEPGIAASPEDAHEALRIGEACLRSLQENRPVRMEEVA